jgi:hypothetical protein
VLRHPFNWKRLLLAGALAYEPDGSDAHLFFELRPGAYNDETLIAFLSDLCGRATRHPADLGRIAVAPQSAHERLGR